MDAAIVLYMWSVTAVCLYLNIAGLRQESWNNASGVVESPGIFCDEGSGNPVLLSCLLIPANVVVNVPCTQWCILLKMEVDIRKGAWQRAWRYPAYLWSLRWVYAVQKNPEVGIRRIPAYTPQYTTACTLLDDHCHLRYSSLAVASVSHLLCITRCWNVLLTDVDGRGVEAGPGSRVCRELWSEWSSCDHLKDGCCADRACETAGTEPGRDDKGRTIGQTIHGRCRLHHAHIQNRRFLILYRCPLINQRA